MQLVPGGQSWARSVMSCFSGLAARCPSVSRCTSYARPPSATCSSSASAPNSAHEAAASGSYSATSRAGRQTSPFWKAILAPGGGRQRRRDRGADPCRRRGAGSEERGVVARDSVLIVSAVDVVGELRGCRHAWPAELVERCTALGTVLDSVAVSAEADASREPSPVDCQVQRRSACVYTRAEATGRCRL
eukprot:776390-Prymnesium_polylepis.2